MDINRENLTRWIRDKFTKGDGGVACTLIGLYQGKQSMGSWPSPQAGGTLGPADVVSAIATAAEDDISGAEPGRHITYHVFAFFGDSRDRTTAMRIRFSLMREYDEEMGDGGSSPDDPNPRGERSQDMRFREKIYSIGFKAISDTQSMLRAENDRLREQLRDQNEVIEGYQKREIAMKEKEQELLDRKADRELAAKKADNEAKIWQQAVDSAKLMTQVVALALTTPKGQPIPHAAVLELQRRGVADFAGTISDDQAIKVMPLMSPFQQSIMVKFAQCREQGTPMDPEEISQFVDSLNAEPERTQKILSVFNSPQQAVIMQMMTARLNFAPRQVSA